MSVLPTAARSLASLALPFKISNTSNNFKDSRHDLNGNFTNSEVEERLAKVEAVNATMVTVGTENTESLLKPEKGKNYTEKKVGLCNKN